MKTILGLNAQCGVENDKRCGAISDIFGLYEPGSCIKSVNIAKAESCNTRANKLWITSVAAEDKSFSSGQGGGSC